jgi:hypothetical protein
LGVTEFNSHLGRLTLLVRNSSLLSNKLPLLKKPKQIF